MFHPYIHHQEEIAAATRERGRGLSIITEIRAGSPAFVAYK